MHSYQNIYHEGQWQHPLPSTNAQLVLLFGERDIANDSSIQDEIRHCFPQCEVIGCTTSGEIYGDKLYDNSLSLTAIEFESSRIEVKSIVLTDSLSVYDAATQMAAQLSKDDLRHVLVFSDGQMVNGTKLIDGLQALLPKNIMITGGLAGDGTRFSETKVWHNNKVESGQIVICGLYGKNIFVGHGTMGGWDPFGPERLITSSKDNILYSVDDKPALELYKKYLGEHAQELPSSALLFPLLIKKSNEQKSVIRTILNIDEANQSMIFAGDIPEGATAQLMRANFDRLIDGAEDAAESAFIDTSTDMTGVALLISCVGRRLVLKQRVEEELEAVTAVLGNNFHYTGFYSYGELSPLINGESCALHNQTMTITTINERSSNSKN